MEIEYDGIEREIILNKNIFNNIEDNDFNETDKIYSNQDLDIIIKPYSENRNIAYIESKYFKYNGFVDKNIQQNGFGRHISKESDSFISIYQGGFCNSEREGPSLGIHYNLNSIFLNNKLKVDYNNKILDSIKKESSIIIGEIKHEFYYDIYMQAWIVDDINLLNDIKNVYPKYKLNKRNTIIVSNNLKIKKAIDFEEDTNIIDNNYNNKISNEDDNYFLKTSLIDNIGNTINNVKIKIFYGYNLDYNIKKGLYIDNINENNRNIYKGKIENNMFHDINAFYYESNKDIAYVGEFIKGVFKKGLICLNITNNENYEVYEYNLNNYYINRDNNTNKEKCISNLNNKYISTKSNFLVEGNNITLNLKNLNKKKFKRIHSLHNFEPYIPLILICTDKEKFIFRENYNSEYYSDNSFVYNNNNNNNNNKKLYSQELSLRKQQIKDNRNKSNSKSSIINKDHFYNIFQYFYQIIIKGIAIIDEEVDDEYLKNKKNHENILKLYETMVQLKDVINCVD